MRLIDHLTADRSPDALYEAFVEWTLSDGIELYPHQDEAIVDILSGNNAIVTTPTGSGKTLIAVAAHFASLAAGTRSYYTAPIKALSARSSSRCATSSEPRTSAWSPATCR